MSDIETIKRTARERAREQGLPYAGAVLPGEAHALMKAGMRMVDVRTRAELEWVGRVPGALPVEWNTWPVRLGRGGRQPWRARPGRRA